MKIAQMTPRISKNSGKEPKNNKGISNSLKCSSLAPLA